MKNKNWLLGTGLLLLLIGLAAWGYQLKEGLIVTNLRNPFNWGLYIATFAFFVGIAAGGLIVSSSVYLFNLEELRPFTRIASLSAFASTLGAGVMVLTDMGRIQNIYNVFLHPNFSSPLIWDVIVISTYMAVTFLSVYIQLLPDWKKEGRGFFNGWPRALSLSEVEAISMKWSKRVSMIGLPVAILIHTVTALIFATQASRGWWNTAILPPDFVAMAVASGTALVLVISLFMVGKDRFNQHKGAFTSLAHIVAGALILHFFLVAMDLMVHWWWGKHEALNVLHVVFGEYGWLYAIELVLPAFTMIYFLTNKGKASMNSLIFGSVLLFIGVYVHRMMLMFPSYNEIPLNVVVPGMEAENWAYPIALGELRSGMEVFVDHWSYSPSLVEIALTMLPFGLVTFVIALAFKLYNFFPQNKKAEVPKRVSSDYPPQGIISR